MGKVYAGKPYDGLSTFLTHVPLSLVVLESYNTRLNEMLEAIDSLAFHNMEERIVKYLKDRAMVLGDDTLKITHYQIARDLNSSRVVISRIMKKLEDNGQVTQSRNMIKVVM